MLADTCLFWIVLFASETLTLSEIFPYLVIIFCSRDDSELGEKMQDNFKKWLNNHFWSFDIFFVTVPIFSCFVVKVLASHSSIPLLLGIMAKVFKETRMKIADQGYEPMN